MGEETGPAAHEAQRLGVLREFGIFDAPSPALARLVDLVADVLMYPVALVSIVEADRLHFKARHGVDVDWVPRSWGLCSDVIAQTDGFFEVPDALADAKFARIPVVSGPPWFRSYAASVLVSSDGQRLGTLCVLDHVPRTLSERERQILSAMARCAVHELEVARLHRQEEELANALGAVERFLGIVSHDLRSPLATIKSNTQLMLRAEEDALAEQRLQRIQRSSSRMGRLIDDLLDFSRIRQGRLKIDARPCELREVVQAVVEDLTRGSETAVRLEAPTACRIVADRDRLQQVVGNLVTNALAHRPPGEPVRVSVRGEPHEVVLEVWNGGPPIPPAMQATLFEPFVGGTEAAQVTERVGLGLGLYISRAIVEAHSGRIAVDSGESRGTTFSVRLPRDEAKSDAVVH